MGKEIEDNKYKAEYEQHGGMDLFIKYVMSETIAPIEDFENAVSLIRQNYHKQINADLLIIGAYLSIMWTHCESEMLEILNLMKPYLPDTERAIVHYLNAYKMYMIEKNYVTNPDYQTELRASLAFNIPFVNNRCRIAECSEMDEAKKYYAEALENVQDIFSEETTMNLPVEHFLEPQSFISEYILGTCMTEDRYNEIKRKANY